MGSKKRRPKVTVEVTPYLRRRMRQRGIMENQIREAVLNPSKKFPNPPNKKTGTLRKKHLKKLGRKSITVIVEYKSEAYLIAVTTYPKSK